MKPFEDFPGSGARLLGRPRTGGSCRTSYGLSLQQMTGQFACAYCGVDLTVDYYRRLLMQVDHVLPVSVGRAVGIPEGHIEDAINKVLACSGCNGFLNRYAPVLEANSSWAVEAFVTLRDMVYAERKRNIEARRAVKIEIFQSKPWEIPTGPPIQPSTVARPKPVFGLAKIPGVKALIDNDAGYLAWIADNPDGFVVNANRRPNASYLILHRATCGTVCGKPSRGIKWTGDFIKACSRDLSALEQWGRTLADGELQPCGHCKPLSSGTRNGFP